MKRFATDLTVKWYNKRLVAAGTHSAHQQLMTKARELVFDTIFFLIPPLVVLLIYLVLLVVMTTPARH